MTGAREAAEADRIREEAVDWVVRLADAPAAETRAAFQRWLGADPRHQAAYARVAGRFETARILQHSTRFPVAPRRSLGPYLVGAGLLAMAASLAIAFLPGAVEPVTTGEGGPAAIVATTPLDGATLLATRKGQIRSIGLPDGTRLTLDTDSAVRMAFDSTSRRMTLLRGRARFAVAPDRRPFSVHAGDGVITDRGTIFDVTLAPDGNVHVQLLRGAVDVAERTDSHRRPVVHRLRAGTQLVFGAATPHAVPQPLASGAASWPQGIVEVDGAALAGLIASANRYTDRPIVLGDPALGDLRVSGRFAVDQPDRLAANLATLLDLRLETRTDAIVLTRG